MLIETKGRVRQKVRTLAKIAGLQNVPRVAFTRKEVEKYYLETRPNETKLPWRKSLFTKRDNCCARAMPGMTNCIWAPLPVSIDTLAHEITHFFTRTNHNTAAFENKKIALIRGKCPAKVKFRWFEVTVTTKYKVYELSANEAKKHYRSNGPIGSPIIIARTVKD